MKRLFLLLFYLLSCSFLHAQKTTNIEDAFKMQLFLNRKNNVFKDMNMKVVKNDSLYRVFNELLVLKIDTLKVQDTMFGFIGQHFSFYRVKRSQIAYTRKLTVADSRYLDIACNPDDYYVLAIDRETGFSYKLAGFETNDFISFLSDFKALSKPYFGKIKILTFLSSYKVEGMDFKCLYNGLRRQEINRDKYPCLKKCSDALTLH